MKYNRIFNQPHPRSVITWPYCWWDGSFDDQELLHMENLLDSFTLDQALILGKEDTNKIRNSKVTFVHKNPDTAWIFNRINGAIENINNEFYSFDLNGYSSFQYTTYSEGEYYGWHMDTCLGDSYLPPDMIQPRKLSLTLVINDGYEGGEFQLNQGEESNPMTCETKKGRIIAFPSFLIHRVTPVTKGIRKSIVVWVVGPKFQ